MKFPGGGGGGGIGQLMAQAQKMQSEMKSMQEKLAVRELDVNSAGGRIKIRINGKQEILAFEIAKEIIDPADPGMLSDLVKVAVNEAVGQSQKMVSSEMSKIIPPGMAGLF
jgi:DNA-binding YbaB/EbfC family protein